MKKTFAVLMIITMIMCFMPAVSFGATAQEDDWDVSRSKTATEMDSDYTSQVTLSLPSAEEPLSSDIVFVLDTSDCVGETMEEIIGTVGQLKEAQEQTGADIKVGVVVFKGSALPMFGGKLVSVASASEELEKMAEEVAASGNKEEVVLKYLNADDDFINKGSNLHSGLMAAKQLLDADTSVVGSRKYVVAATDGMTYYWNDAQGNVYGIYSSSRANGEAYPSLLFYGWQEAYNIGSGYSLSEDINAGNWDEYIAGIEDRMNDDYVVNVREAKEKFATNYSGVRFSTVDALSAAGYKYISKADGKQYAHGLEYSVIKCMDTYGEMISSGYNCYTINVKYGTDAFPGLFTAKLNEMAGISEQIDFSKIKNDILYTVGAGSWVEDTIGEKFDFVNNVDKVTLTVNGQQLAKAQEGNIYYFGDADVNPNNFRFKLEYVPSSDSSTEKIIWTINENVSNFAPVQLTYTVKLVKPDATPGTYGVTDLNGDGIVDGTQTQVDSGKALYTNESAILYPVDSNGNANYSSIEFGKPSVSYTIQGQVPETGDTAMNHILPYCFLLILLAMAGIKLKSLKEQRG